MDQQRTSRRMTHRHLPVDNATKATIEKLRSSDHTLEWITAEAVKLGLTDPHIGPVRGLLPGTPQFPHPHRYDISHTKDQGEAIKRIAQAQGVTEEGTLRSILVAGLDMLLERLGQTQSEDNLR